MNKSPESLEQEKSPAVAMVERELGGLSLNEVSPNEVVAATKEVMDKLAEHNDSPEGLTAEQYDLLERVACIRGVYESIAHTKRLIDSYKSRLGGVPLPQFANDNATEQQRVAA